MYDLYISFLRIEIKIKQLVIFFKLWIEFCNKFDENFNNEIKKL